MSKPIYKTDASNGGKTVEISPEEISYDETLASKLLAVGGSNIYNITHMSDLDGISSAALLFRFFSMPLDHAYFVDYNIATIENVSQSMHQLNLSGATIIITDFSSNAANLESMGKFITEQKHAGNSVIWLDHHPWSSDAIAKIFGMLDYGIAGENNLYCGAEIVYKVLCSGSDDVGIGKEIADHAHVADFNLLPPPPPGDTSPNISLAINYYAHVDKSRLYEGLRGFVKDVSEGDYESEGIANATSSYRETANAEFKKMKESMVTLNTNGIKVIIGFGKLMHATSACGMLHDQTGADLVIYVRTDEKAVSLRSWGDVNCSNIAFKMHGGGHPHAAAFRIDEFTSLDTDAGRQEFIKIISPLIGLSVGNDNTEDRGLGVQ
ncbi:MAG: DHH family phosphoesterase [Candidatus Micrarchaeia archaeon]